MPDVGVCPVCQTDTFLVRHHDHFGDNCLALLTKHFVAIYEQRTGGYAGFPASDGGLLIESHRDYFYTFPDTPICQPCNTICADVKRAVRSIPRWVSFSPAEMIALRVDPELSGFAVLWKVKKETYRPRLRTLVELGVERASIERMWNDRSRQSSSNTEMLRRAMLARLAKSPEIEQLAEAKRNERAIARIMRAEGWTSREANSFIYWYHKKHGDPSCRNNEFGIGEMAYAEWFRELACGDAAAAELELRRRLNFAEWQRRHG